MQELKFRAWNKLSKFMEGHEWTIVNLPKILKSENKNMIVMQCTGMVDKNKVKIFEGDIVKCKYPAPHNAEIKKTSVMPSFIFQRYDRGFDCDQHWDFFKNNGGEIEVLGNIYENEEFLNKKK